jgi:hypothetical protein
MENRPQLMNVPPELQMGIVSYLDHASLQAILRTCKQLYAITLPWSVRAYKSKFQPGGGRRAEFVDVWKATMARVQLSQFLRYVTIVRPELAQEVRTLDVPALPVVTESKSIPSDDDLPFFRQLAATFTIDPDVFVKRLQLGYPVGVLALLIAACPRLERLCVPSDTRSAIREVLAAAAANPSVNDESGCGQRPLAHLREVYHHFDWVVRKYRQMLDDTVSFFRLPSLESYEAMRPPFNGDDDPDMDPGAYFRSRVPERSSPVEHIILRQATLSPLMMINLIQSCRALRSFDFTWCINDRAPREAMPRGLMDGTLCHASTLEYLHANFEDDWQKRGWAQQPDRITLGTDLRQMTALKTLVMSMHVLTGMLHSAPYRTLMPEDEPQMPLEVEGAPRLVQCLPNNLEDLEIHGCWGKILEQAQELLDVAATGSRFRRLRRFALFFDKEKMETEDLGLCCKSPKTKLEIIFQTREERWK